MATSNTFSDNNDTPKTVADNNTQANQDTSQTSPVDNHYMDEQRITQNQDTVQTSPVDNTTTTDDSTTGAPAVTTTTDGGTIGQNTVPLSNGGYTNGLSQQEISDPNKITVAISDSTTPIVVLFGSPACGKTTMLIRLTQYLRTEGYTVEPASDFRPTYDEVHNDMCRNFNKLVESTAAPESTGRINFMLLMVRKGSKPVCQILEGPGEYYFDPQNPSVQFPSFVNTIKNCSNRKLWAVMVLPTKGSKLDTGQKKQYATKMGNLKKMLNPKDKVMFVLNKVDLSQVLLNAASIDYKQAKKDIEDQYKGIFEPFRNDHPITKLWKPYNCELEVFNSGDFPEAADGTKQFDPGSDIYPKRLWAKITKQIL